jgi:hypothetical protein
MPPQLSATHGIRVNLGQPTPRNAGRAIQVCIDDDETPSKGIRGLLSLFKKRAVPS